MINKDWVDPRKWSVSKKLGSVSVSAKLSQTAGLKAGGLLLAAAVGYMLFASAAGAAMTLCLFTILMLTLDDTLGQPINAWETKHKFAYAILLAVALFGDQYTDALPLQAVLLGAALVVAFNCWIAVMLASYLANSNAPPSKPS
jgi:hypothetical protein